MTALRYLWLAAFMVGAMTSDLGAQAALFDGGQFQVRCRQADCIQALRDSVAQLQARGLSGAEFDSQIGALAAVLFAAAKDASDPALAQISQALLILAQFSSDVNQQESLIWVAGQLANGASDLFNLEDPFAVSPS
jgi:hypothetical protein